MKRTQMVFLVFILVIVSTAIIVGVIDKTQKLQADQSFNATDISNLPLTMSISQSANSTESLNHFNITKGQTITINAEVDINSEHPEVTMPFYLSIGAFENKPSSKIIASPPSPYPIMPWPSHDDSPNMKAPFKATFNLNPIKVQPNQNAYSTITITALEEAQIGTYTLLVEIGNCKITSVGGSTFYLTVLPKE
jgi:hypothetical protein